jgi:hypothetical protein
LKEERIEGTTVGIVERNEVEVVVVKEGGHICITGFVAVDELVGEVFDYCRMSER